MASIAHSFARYLPPRVVTNEDLAQQMDTSDEWIRQRTGIEERRWVEAPTTTSDLAVEACKLTVEAAGVDGVDAIIAATLSPVYDFPGVGVLIQSKLGLDTVPAFDVRDQCSGFLYSLQMADAFVRSGVYQKILVVGAEVHSTGIDITTRGRDVAVLFGDGAGSCIVSKRDGARAGLSLVESELHSQGEFAKELWCEHVGSAHFPVRVTADLVEEAKIFPSMNGKKVFEHAVKRMIEVSGSVLEKAGVVPEEIRYFVPHQANLRINSMVGKQLGMKEEACISTIQKYGNTTAATIPIGMSHLIEECELQDGDLVLSAAFGSGFTWGASLFRWKQ